MFLVEATDYLVDQVMNIMPHGRLNTLHHWISQYFSFLVVKQAGIGHNVVAGILKHGNQRGGGGERWLAQRIDGKMYKIELVK